MCSQLQGVGASKDLIGLWPRRFRLRLMGNRPRTVCKARRDPAQNEEKWGARTGGQDAESVTS